MSDSVDFIAHKVQAAESFEEVKSILKEWVLEREHEIKQKSYVEGYDSSTYDNYTSGCGYGC